MCRKTDAKIGGKEKEREYVIGEYRERKRERKRVD